MSIKYCVLACWLLASSVPAIAQQITEPGGRPEDTQLAMTNPNEYAWRLFFYVNHQAKHGTAGVADATKKTIRDYDPDRDVVWEAWALASGLVVERNPDNSLRFVDNKSEVYKRPATEPIPWEQLSRGASKQPLTPNLQGLFPVLNIGASSKRGDRMLMTLAAPPGAAPGDEEVRMNKSTYETIRARKIYSVEGLEEAAAQARAAGERAVVRFDAMSKEVKAQWVPLSSCEPDKPCTDKNRYHWRIVTDPKTSEKQVWGLASLHIITKDLPNWFWADFGHIDCEQGVGPCADFSADPGNPLRDSTTHGQGNQGAGPSGSEGKRTETLNSKWEFYRLRGTQIDFITAGGAPTILSNPVIESSFQKSSCMTCHALATVGIRGTVPDTGTSLPRFMREDFVRNIGSSPPPRPDIGAPNCGKFFNKPSGLCDDDQATELPLYFQTDFLWSLPFRVFSRK